MPKGGWRIKIKDRRGKMIEIKLTRPCVCLMSQEFQEKTTKKVPLWRAAKVHDKIFPNIPCLCEMLKAVKNGA